MTNDQLDNTIAIDGLTYGQYRAVIGLWLMARMTDCHCHVLKEHGPCTRCKTVERVKTSMPGVYECFEKEGMGL